MDMLSKKTDNEIVRSMLAEIAKSKAELLSAEADLNKVRNRISFLIVLTNEMINRLENK